VLQQSWRAYYRRRGGPSTTILKIIKYSATLAFMPNHETITRLHFYSRLTDKTQT